MSRAPTSGAARFDYEHAPGTNRRTGSAPAARTALRQALDSARTDAPDQAPGAPRRFTVTSPNRRDRIMGCLLVLADVAAALGGLGILGLVSGRPLTKSGLVTLPIMVLIAKLTGRYDHDDVVVRKSTLDEAPALLSLAGAYTLAWSLVALVSRAGLNLGGGEAIILWASTSALLVALRLGARAVVQRSGPRERVLIIGGAVARANLAHSIASDPLARVEVAGFLPLEDERRRPNREWVGRSRRARSIGFADLPTVVEELNIDRVLLIASSTDSELMLDAVRRTMGVGVKVSIVPQLFEVIGSSVEFDFVGGVTVLGVRSAGLSRSSRAAKRVMDVLGALAGLLVTGPVAITLAAAVKLDSPGPVFFRQPRVGRDGRHFPILKFRTMIDGADAQRDALMARNETSGVFKLSRDPRVTRVGRWLRRTSLDELPQLLNVLRGEMSLVGPRPLVLDEDRLVEGRHRERLALPPGMTGPWQVLGPRRPPLSEMVKTDYLYAANWSLWTDVKILLRTFGHMLSRRGL